jgi:hypothetical protein
MILYSYVWNFFERCGRAQVNDILIKGNRMNKKMATILIAAAALALLIIAGGCASSQVSDDETFEDLGLEGSGVDVTDGETSATEGTEPDASQGEISDTEPLTAMVDSEDEAKEIAGLYGITLVSYEYGIATFYTEEDPEQVIQRGIENGYPELEINYTVDLM